MTTCIRLSALACIVASACAAPGDSPSIARDGLWLANVTLVNSHWRDLLRHQDTLRTGQALYLQTVNPALVRPHARFRLSVEHLGTGAQLIAASPLADARGLFEMTPVLTDVGQDDGLAPGDRLRVLLDDGEDASSVELTVDGRDGGDGEFAGAARDPLVQATDADGVAANSFVVSGLAPGETRGPVYVSGAHFRKDVDEVAIYVVEDRDRWAGETIPRAKTGGLVAGPIRARIVDGRLPPTSTRFTPSATHLGAYDILVDVDRDGLFDYEHDHKDGVDGEAKIGFTVQHSRAYLASLKDRHILVNLAYDSPSRSGGTWRNVYRAGDKVFVYVNPPFNRAHHGHVLKWVVAHRDFASFWDQPGTDGAVPFAHLAFGPGQDSTPQRGCTNTPPVYVFGAERRRDPETGQPIDRYDLVLDYDRDGRYTAGVDILDVASLDGGAGVIPPATARGLAPGAQGGFRVE